MNNLDDGFGELKGLGLNEKENGRLISITNGYKNSKGWKKKLAWSVPAVYVIGSMPHGAQDWFCKKTGAFTPRQLTNLNLAIFGVGWKGLECYLALYAGKEIKEFLGDAADLVDISSKTEVISGALDVTYETAVYIYSLGLGPFQSGIRALYTNTNFFNRKGKGAWSASGSSSIWNIPYLAGWSLKKGLKSIKKSKTNKLINDE